MNNSVSDTVKAAIEAQIVATMRTVPDCIEELVKAAISQPVDKDTGSTGGYGSSRIPYLDYVVGETIRRAARDAVTEAVKERLPEINAAIKRQISADSIVEGMCSKIVGIIGEEWKVNVSFKDESEKSRY